MSYLLTRAGLRSVLVAATLACCASGSAATNDHAYQALRDWIATTPAANNVPTPGRHLNEADRAQLEHYLPRPAWTYYFFAGMDMEIAPTGDYASPPGWGQNITTDYHLDARGVLKGFRGGGRPFPEIAADDPQAAVKVIWNMIWRPGHQDFDMPMVTWLRSEHGKLDRKLEYISTSATYARGECLVPGYEEVKGKRLMEFRSPRDMAGAKNMLVTYVDHDREDSGWLYLPAQRKPRRTLASERTSELMGMDMISEDIDGFNGKVYENNWTYLGTRDVLAMKNVRDNPEFGGPHQWVPHKARWEVRRAHVVMIEPKSSKHPYSHRIVFIDANTYWTLWMFAFDRSDDQLLRMSQPFLKYSESYATELPRNAPYLKQDLSKNAGHHVFFHLGESDINAKKPHATVTHCYVKRRLFTPARARQHFSLRNMISGRR
jgi:hypothetical protein